ncbi:MAG: PRC-barrel domain-containing protein [Candidatus Borkfalkiaceae bacterium]|nr:PRC-barrel domain-containing protein [Clostridia bacterium]MDY6222901.1 PRC-barrel domain-containing protein [Christensenellaceae bacterium]
MEISYTYLRSKEVVNVADGKRLGRVCDVVFRYPENVFMGIVVPGCKGFSLKKGDVFIDVKCIVCIGEDVILIRAEGLRKNGKPSPKQSSPCRTSSCQPCPPLCPPSPCPPSPCPPHSGDLRRSFDEYE